MLGVALLIWAVLWWVERAPVEVAALRQARAHYGEARAMSLTYCGASQSHFNPHRPVVRVPLQQAMVLVWGLGVISSGGASRVGTWGGAGGLCHARG